MKLSPRQFGGPHKSPGKKKATSSGFRILKLLAMCSIFQIEQILSQEYDLDCSSFPDFPSGPKF